MFHTGGRGHQYSPLQCDEAELKGCRRRFRFSGNDGARAVGATVGGVRSGRAGWTTNTSESKFSVHASARPQGERDA